MIQLCIHIYASRSPARRRPRQIHECITDMGCISGSLSAAAGGETDDVSCELRPMGCITGSPSAAGCETDDVS